MAEYFHVPLMQVWQSLSRTAEDLKSGNSEHAFATFLLSAFCRQIVDGHIAVATDMNGVDFDDFVWSIEVLYLASTGQSAALRATEVSDAGTT